MCLSSAAASRTQQVSTSCPDLFQMQLNRFYRSSELIMKADSIAWHQYLQYKESPDHSQPLAFLKGSSERQLLLEGHTLTSNRPLKFSQLWIAETRPFPDRNTDARDAAVRWPHSTRAPRRLIKSHKDFAFLLLVLFIYIQCRRRFLPPWAQLRLHVYAEAFVAINVEHFRHRLSDRSLQRQFLQLQCCSTSSYTPFTKRVHNLIYPLTCFF